jgi:hypothetical protein
MVDVSLGCHSLQPPCICAAQQQLSSGVGSSGRSGAFLQHPLIACLHYCTAQTCIHKGQSTQHEPKHGSCHLQGRWQLSVVVRAATLESINNHWETGNAKDACRHVAALPKAASPKLVRCSEWQVDSWSGPRSCCVASQAAPAAPKFVSGFDRKESWSGQNINHAASKPQAMRGHRNTS